MRAILALMLLFPRAAYGDPCERAVLPAPAPIGLGPGPSDFGSTPAACAQKRADLAGRAALLVDEPDFYGGLGADVVLSAAYALREDLWLSASLAALEWRFVQSATIVATQTDLGPATLAVHAAAIESDRLRVAPYMRALLPTGTAYRYATLFGGEPGVAAVYVPASRWALSFGLSTPVTGTLLGSRARWTLEPRVTADAAFAPWTWFEPALGLEVRAGGDAAGPIETIAPAMALRFFPWRGLQAKVACALPLVGADRTDLRLLAAVGYTL